MANINKIRLSGQTYDIQDQNASKTVELTQAQYDALVVKDPNTFYIITDAQGADLSNYYTKSETSGATEISTALASKQTTLTAGTNITIVDNVISATGGGGSSYTAGDGIDITNDVISVKQISGDTTFVDATSTLENETSVTISTSAIIVTMKEGAVGGGVTFTDNNGCILTVENNGSSLDVLGNTSYFNYSTDGYSITASTLASGDTFISISNDSGNQLGWLVEYFAILATTYSLQDFADNVYGKFSGKVDVSTFNTYSGSVDTALAGKQSTLVSGTNIKTINNESILGSGNIDIQGGGKAVAAGRGISVTTGETADTVSISLPISAGTGTSSIVGGKNSSTQGNYSFVFGLNNTCGRNTIGTYIFGESNAVSYGCSYTSIGGYSNTATTVQGGHIEGMFNKITNNMECTSGRYNVSNKANTTFGDSGNTLFSVGNGTSDNARHNAFEIRQNGDIYLTKDGQDVKLQDQLGGSSITVDTALNSGSTNPVQNKVIYNKIDEVEQVTAAGLNVLNDNFGGLKLMKISQTDYDNLQVKDQNTLYIVI